MDKIQVEVILKKFGSHKKGAILEMEETTALACVKNKAVKLLDSKKDK